MNDLSKISAIIMAGGKGTRMKSEKPKVLHTIGGEPMIFHTIKNLHAIGIRDVVVIVCYAAEEVKNALNSKFQVRFGHQLQPLGTADAVNAGLKEISNAPETILVLGGDDSAFYTSSTLNELILSHFKTQAILTMMTLIDPNRDQVGKVFRDKSGKFEQHLEYSEYSKLDLKSNEINCGVYLFNLEWLKLNLPKIEKNPTKGEYYLTDLVNIANSQKQIINIFNLKKSSEWFGINTPEELERANRLWQSKSNE